MGSGRDKRKKQKGKTPGVGAEKTAAKTAQKQAKRAAKVCKDENEDLDALLEQFALDDEAKSTVQVVEDCSPPSARVFASFTPNPLARGGEIIVFGGEYFDNAADQIHTFNDLFRFSCSKQQWTKLVVPNGPPPRTSHQAAIIKRCLFVYGGELTSLNQKKFRHYSDVWRLDLDSLTWDKLPAKGGPKARSGHRMVAHKNRLIMFGGFHDDGSAAPEYFCDVWTYDTDSMQWACHSKGDGPSPRGGHQLALHSDSLFAFGGHTAWMEDGQEREKVHDEVWKLDLKTYQLAGAAAFAGCLRHLCLNCQHWVQWEKVKKAGMAPGARASFGMAVHKNRAIMVGGITDQRGQGDKLYSTLHDDMYLFNMETSRWLPLAMRVPKRNGAAGAAPDQADHSSTPEGQGAPAESLAAQPEAQVPGVLRQDVSQHLQHSGLDTSSAAYRAAVRIQSRFRGFAVRKAYKSYRLGGSISELLYSPALYGIDLSAADAPRPRARSSAMCCTVGNNLWLFGGIVEIELCDLTLDDLWTLDLNRCDGWKCVKENTAKAGQESVGEEPDEGTEDSE